MSEQNSETHAAHGHQRRNLMDLTERAPAHGHPYLLQARPKVTHPISQGDLSSPRIVRKSEQSNALSFTGHYAVGLYSNRARARDQGHPYLSGARPKVAHPISQGDLSSPRIVRKSEQSNALSFTGHYAVGLYSNRARARDQGHPYLSGARPKVAHPISQGDLSSPRIVRKSEQSNALSFTGHHAAGLYSNVQTCPKTSASNPYELCFQTSSPSYTLGGNGYLPQTSASQPEPLTTHPANRNDPDKVACLCTCTCGVPQMPPSAPLSAHHAFVSHLSAMQFALNESQARQVIPQSIWRLPPASLSLVRTSVHWGVPRLEAGAYLSQVPQALYESVRTPSPLFPHLSYAAQLSPLDLSPSASSLHQTEEGRSSSQSSRNWPQSPNNDGDDEWTMSDINEDDSSEKNLIIDTSYEEPSEQESRQSDIAEEDEEPSEQESRLSDMAEEDEEPSEQESRLSDIAEEDEEPSEQESRLSDIAEEDEEPSEQDSRLSDIAEEDEEPSEQDSRLSDIAEEDEEPSEQESRLSDIAEEDEEPSEQESRLSDIAEEDEEPSEQESRLSDIAEEDVN
ncbi:hypothetical protein BgiMline_010414 [Biomphalaria glabrata]|nr:hypothetical protein BgiMline_024144 [Biomphalaria glabrata]